MRPQGQLYTRPHGSPRVHYAWLIALVTFLVMLITAGVRATPGLFMVPLEAEFGFAGARRDTGDDLTHVTAATRSRLH